MAAREATEAGTDTAALPLPALLSFAWTGFTIEVDNAFEQRMPHRTTTGSGGTGPWLVSHAMWWTCLRHVGETTMRLREVEALARTKTNLQGMIRWGFVTADGPSRIADPRIRVTRHGLRARAVWLPLPAEIEENWRLRTGGEALPALKASLAAISADLDPSLPDCMPILGYGLLAPPPLRHAAPAGEEAPPLVAMLARVLLAFTLDFERRTGASLAIGSNVLRLLGEDAAPVRALPRRAGVSKEAIAVALAFLSRRGMATLDVHNRQRTVRLTPSGIDAKAAWKQTLADTEAAWRHKSGDGTLSNLRHALRSLGGGSLLAAAMTGSRQGWRADWAPETLPWQPMVLHRGGYPDGA